MKKYLSLSFALLFTFSSSVFAQQPVRATAPSQPTANSNVSGNHTPYKTSFAVDGTLSIVGVAVNGLGLYLIQKNKHAPSAAELAAIDADLEAAKQDVNSFDRFAAGNFNMDAKKASDFPFYGSFAMPFFLLLDKDISNKAGQVGVLYLETMALTGALFTMTVAHVERNRPLVYNNDPDNTERIKKHAQNSFYAGHTAATAAATFFTAKVFHDFNPNSNARFYVWTGAALVPAAVGYLRMEAGKHFLSDNLLGYALGAGAGILVPQLHKKSDRLSLYPTRTIDLNGNEYEGVGLTYKF